MSLTELQTPFGDLTAVIESFDADDVASYLTEGELAQVAEYRSEKRRHEWIASRIALRRLAQARGLVSDPLALQIMSAARPPRAAAESALAGSFVSFSHSANAGAAAIDERRIGVDLEQIRQVEPRLRKFFLNDLESQLVDETHLQSALIHLWAAKEAAFKLVSSLTLLKEIKLEPWEVNDLGLEMKFRGGELRGTIRTAQLDERFILALAREA